MMIRDRSLNHDCLCLYLHLHGPLCDDVMMLIDDVMMLYNDVPWWCDDVHDVDMMMMMHDNKMMWDVWWWNNLIWRDTCIKCHDALWRRVFKDNLVNVNDDERMKANACMLLIIMCERCIGLCHKDDSKMKTVGTLCILCVHIHRDTFSFMMKSTDTYTMIMMMIMSCMTLRVCWSSDVATDS